MDSLKFRILLTFILLVPLQLGAQQKPASSGLKEIPRAMATRGKDSCVKCHENQAATKLNQPVLDWMMSVHATRGQSCNGCHGGNPEVFDEKESKQKKYGFIGKPTRKNITEFCGRGGCHAQELKEFKKGPHYKTVLETGLPSCITCHGSHNVKKSSSDIIDNRNCSVCHEQDYATEMLKTMKLIEFGIDNVQENISILKQKHAKVENLSERLNRTRKLFIQFVHIFSSDQVQQTETIIKLSLTNLKRESQALRALSQRLDILYYAMLILGVLITFGLSIFTILTLLARRRIRRGLG